MQDPRVPRGSSAQDPGQSKKPYGKPAIILEDKLEAVAAVCSGIDGKSTGVCFLAFS
jgi:hypothetical protein